MARRKKPPAYLADKPTNPEDVELGRALKAARQAAGKTQHDIGALFDISHQQISKYERGASSLPVYKLLRIATYLGTPAERFLQAIGAQPGFGEPQRSFAGGSPTRDLKQAMDRIMELWPKARESLP